MLRVQHTYRYPVRDRHLRIDADLRRPKTEHEIWITAPRALTPKEDWKAK